MCRQWHSASRSSKTLWATVEWRGTDKSSLGDLRWLSGRGPVKQASLVLGPHELPVTAFSLGAWAGSLQALELEAQCGETVGYDFLASLRHLTLLALQVSTDGAADQFKGVSTLVRLRSLSWVVDVSGSVQMDDEDLQLPLPPNLEHLQVCFKDKTVWRLGGLSALTRLQTLVLCEIPFEAAALGAVTGVTCLKLDSCDLAEVPAVLSALAELRILELADGGLGDSPASQASLLLVAQLPKLEFLRLAMPGMLPPLGQLSSPQLLRGLELWDDFYGPTDFASYLDASWLGSLEALKCYWWQVSYPVDACIYNHLPSLWHTLLNFISVHIAHRMRHRH